MPEWSPDVVVDEALARRLIGRQFPELELGSLRFFAAGWENAIWLVDDLWAFRFPQREVALPGIKLEMALLPRLAPLLPIPIPNPVFFGHPAEGYPWPFFGAALLPGRDAAEAGLDDAARNRLAAPLAAFLRILHSAELNETLSAASAVPADPLRRVDMTHRVPAADERLTEVEQLGLWRRPPAVRRVLESAHGLPASRASVVVHGDLHFRHVLVDEKRAPAGVIDWSDLCRADPSVDLQLVWTFIPLEARARFLEEYGSVTEDQLLRARVLALFMCAALAVYGHDQEMRAVEREAVEGLERASLD